jgi:hypothetical protein
MVLKGCQLGTCEQTDFVTVPVISPFKDPMDENSEIENVYDTITMLQIASPTWRDRVSLRRRPMLCQNMDFHYAPWVRFGWFGEHSLGLVDRTLIFMLDSLIGI